MSQSLPSILGFPAKRAQTERNRAQNPPQPAQTGAIAAGVSLVSSSLPDSTPFPPAPGNSHESSPCVPFPRDVHPSPVSDGATAPLDPAEAEAEGEDPSVEAAARPEWTTMLPVSACRRADSVLTEDEELASKGSDQAAHFGESSVDGRPPETDRHEGVSSQPPLSGNREPRLQSEAQGG